MMSSNIVVLIGYNAQKFINRKDSDYLAKSFYLYKGLFFAYNKAKIFDD